MFFFPHGQVIDTRPDMAARTKDERAPDVASEVTTRARRAMRPELRRAAARAWEHDQAGLRYLAGR